MQPILVLYHRLIDLYEYQVETASAVLLWRDRLEDMASGGGTTLDSRLFFGRNDNPNRPDALYQVARTFGDLILDAEEGGRNLRLLGNGVIVHAYSLWEDTFRAAIAAECGLTKDDIESDVFQDLNKYRQAILHVDGRLDRQPKVLTFFKMGEVVSFTQDQIQHLFAGLISELNRIGETYYGQDPGLSLDKHLNRPVQS